MVKSAAILVGTWYSDANVGSTLIARILAFFSIDSMNVVDFTAGDIVFDLRMPEAARKVDEIFFFFDNFNFFFNFEFKSLSFGDS
jgi:hypothetical protein